jgi:hypothetical protein
MFPFGYISISFLFTIVATGYGIAALVQRPISKYLASGRTCAYTCFVLNLIVLPVYLWAAPGTNIRGRVYALGITPLALGIIAIAIYPRSRKEVRGFEVIPPKGGPGAG